MRCGYVKEHEKVERTGRGHDEVHGDGFSFFGICFDFIVITVAEGGYSCLELEYRPGLVEVWRVLVSDATATAIAIAGMGGRGECGGFCGYAPADGEAVDQSPANAHAGPAPPITIHGPGVRERLAGAVAWQVTTALNTDMHPKSIRHPSPFSNPAPYPPR